MPYSSPTIHSMGHDIQTERYKHVIRRQVILFLTHIMLPRSLEKYCEVKFEIFTDMNCRVLAFWFSKPELKAS